MFRSSGQTLKPTAGAEKIICHKMKQESSLYLLHSNSKKEKEKKRKEKLSLNELGIVLRQEQQNDLSKGKRNILLLKMSWGLKENFYVLTFYNLNYIRRE